MMEDRMNDESVLDAVFAPIDGVVSEQSGDELILLNTADQSSYYLNGSAALIWALLDGERSVRAMHGILAEAYEDGPAAEEIVASIQEFVSAGVVRRA
jgi:hypothetical protein